MDDSSIKNGSDTNLTLFIVTKAGHVHLKVCNYWRAIYIIYQAISQDEQQSTESITMAPNATILDGTFLK